MKLRDLSRRIREEDRPDISFALQGGLVYTYFRE